MNDAALTKMLPAGWETAIAEKGPAKDCNLRTIFIDRMAIMGADGKPGARPTARLVYFAIPVKQTATGAVGQMIIHGLVDNAADAPGAFGVYQHATTACMSRRRTASCRKARSGTPSSRYSLGSTGSAQPQAIQVPTKTVHSTKRRALADSSGPFTFCFRLKPA